MFTREDQGAKAQPNRHGGTAGRANSRPNDERGSSVAVAGRLNTYAYTPNSIHLIMQPSHLAHCFRRGEEFAMFGKVG